MEISALGVWLVELSVAGVGRECRQLLAWDSMTDQEKGPFVGSGVARKMGAAWLPG